MDIQQLARFGALSMIQELKEFLKGDSGTSNGATAPAPRKMRRRRKLKGRSGVEVQADILAALKHGPARPAEIAKALRRLRKPTTDGVIRGVLTNLKRQGRIKMEKFGKSHSAPVYFSLVSKASPMKGVDEE